MNRLNLQLAAMLLDPRVTRTPLRVLAQLRARGVRRVPEAVDRDLRAGAHRGEVLRLARNWLDGERLTWHRGRWVLNSFLPPIPSPGYRRMFTNLLSGRHLSPVSAFLAVTGQCACSCWHCSLRGRSGGELTTDQWLATVRQLSELGTSIVGFTGGEPLLRAGLCELVAAAKDGGMSVILFTAGADDPLRALARLKRAGLWACCVSLDADSAEVHDATRGLPGAFERACRTLQASRRLGLYTMTGSVATRTALASGLPARIHALGRRLGVHESRWVEAMPCGALAAGHPELLAPADIEALRRFHVETNRRGLLPKICAFNQIESPEVFGCGAGTQHLFVQPDGTVCPCDFTPLGFGNAAREPLETIWRRMNVAMGDNPRRDCFIRKHHACVACHASAGYPLPPDLSAAVCREAGAEPLPAYFAMVTGQSTQSQREDQS